MNNARFWIYCNSGPVKLCLKPGQSLSHCDWRDTDEGWSCEWTQWSLSDDGLMLHRSWCSDGRDCDGRLTCGGEDVCPNDPVNLSFNEPYMADLDESERKSWADVMWPNWHHESDFPVYDEYAQIDGY